MITLDEALANYADGQTLTKAAQSCDTYRHTFREIAKARGITIRPRGLPRLSKEQQDYLIKAYQSDVEVRQIAKQLGVAANTVTQYAQREGLTSKRKMTQVPAHLVPDALSAYSSGEPLASIAARFDTNVHMIIHLAMRAGVPLRGPSKKFTDTQIQEISEAYLAGETIASLSQRFGVNGGAITYHTDKLGLARRGRTGAPHLYTGNEIELECKRCRKTLPLDAFNKPYSAQTHRKGSLWCKACTCEVRACSLYKITPEHYHELRSIRTCPICGDTPSNTNKNRNMCIDHCHRTGVIRGVICGGCNSGIGMVRDSTDRLRALIQYLSVALTLPAPVEGAPGDQQSRHRLRTYGVHPNQFQFLWDFRSGGCHCCGAPFGTTKPALPHVDHCHTTGRIRGLLCSNCNVALGSFKDSQEIITKAITYLEGTPQ